jgi:glycosyltransferase involved in cell wall biosynthesis
MQPEDKKLKIILVSPSPPPAGGIASWTVNLLEYSKYQNQVEFFYVDSAVKYRGIYDMRLWKRITAGIRITLDLVRAIKKIVRVNDLCVIHLISSGSLALLKDYHLLKLASKFKVPVIIHWRFGRIPELAIKNNWEWWLISYIISKSAYSIVIDENSHQTLIDAGHNNVTYIPNPVSEDLAKIARNYKNPVKNVEEGKIVFVGHIEKEKGVYELVEACSTSVIVKKLELIGPFLETDKTKLEKIALKRGDGTWLIFEGEISRCEVHSKIQTSELLVLPSYTEGFPNVILEAMAMGCAVVATNVGAIAQMLNIQGESASGECVPVKDIEALRTSIEKILSNKELRFSYGQNGLSRVLKYYTFETIFNQYVEIWKKASTINVVNII